MKLFMAYANETDSLTIGELNVENRLDRISLYGSLELTKDKEGLQNAYELKYLVDSTIEALCNQNLPDHIEVRDTESVENPFT
jgi:hypothetical protein